MMDLVLVPFPGFLYLYVSMKIILSNWYRSRPLPGVLISLLGKYNEGELVGVLVPFPGFLYLYPVLAIP